MSALFLLVVKLAATAGGVIIFARAVNVIRKMDMRSRNGKIGRAHV